MSFLAPLALALGLLAVPIILLYMLRLRRRETTISSTLLWQQLLRDKEANAPWQKLKRNLLLILQLIILAALVLALSRPYTEVPTVSAGRTALLIDDSASMTTIDVQPSRLEVARQKAYEVINALGESDTLSIIRVSAVPEVVAPYTNNREQLRAALARIQPDNASADWTAALTLASAGYAGAQKFSIVIIGDGGLPANLPAVPGGDVKYLPVGASDANTAISALAVAEDPSTGPQLYARLTNYGSQNADVIFSVKLDDTLFNAQNYTLPAKSSLDVVVPSLPKTFRRAEADLLRPAASTVPDYLTVDDTAYTVYNPASAGRVLIMTPRNRFIEQGFASLPGWQSFKGDVSKNMPTDRYDLYVFDGYLPPTLPNAPTLIINPPGSSPLFTITGKTSQPIRGGTVRKDDPRTANVRFENVNIREVKTLGNIAWATPLVTANNGELPLLLAGEQNGQRIAVIPFNLYDSDLPLQITWPILLSDLTNWFRTPHAIEVPNGLQTYQTLAIRPVPEADLIRVHRPDGATTTLKPGEGSLIYAETTLPGIYTLEVYRGADVLQSEVFAVNLFDPLESRIAPAASVSVGSIATPAAAPKEIGQQEYWPWIALIGLLILSVEWYVYQRGTRLPARFTANRPGNRLRKGLS